MEVNFPLIPILFTIDIEVPYPNPRITRYKKSRYK